MKQAFAVVPPCAKHSFCSPTYLRKRSDCLLPTAISKHWNVLNFTFLDEWDVGVCFGVFCCFFPPYDLFGNIWIVEVLSVIEVISW